MSGHSKWSTIKRKKGAEDAKRGKIFTRLARDIAMAAKEGGGDEDGNPKLKLAVAKAKAENMPKDNIERAIQRGTGKGEGIEMEEMTFEGYGLEGVAFIVDTLTDNKNRTLAEVKRVFSRAGGSDGDGGVGRVAVRAKGLHRTGGRRSRLRRSLHGRCRSGRGRCGRRRRHDRRLHPARHVRRGRAGA